mmetsp:Transcript_75613/g.244655  ORF Transcript_75613/g.244655 Transcript_75613/m.244655 type:complete len:230 (-) Transcript_75613:1539-2228(-)
MAAASVSKSRSFCTAFAGTPSSSSSLPPGSGYITSTVPASSSTKEMMALRALSCRTTRTALPQDSKAAAFCLPPEAKSTLGGAGPPICGRSSAQLSCSPALRRWMRSWLLSQASALRGSSGSDPSSRATSCRKSARLWSSPSSSPRLPSSLMKLCLRFISNVRPSSPCTTRPQDSGESFSPKATRWTFSERAASMRLRTGSNSALMSSCVLWSRRATALMFMQLMSSLP